MKQILYILIPLSLFGFKSSEIINGKFYNHTAGDKIEYYDFQPNGRFEYLAECEYIEYGHGKYQLKNNKLILDYLAIDEKEKGHFETREYKTSSEYSDTIYFRIQDSKTQELLEGATIYYKDTRIAALTVNDGQTKIHRENKDLIISFIGYKDLIINKNKILDKETYGFNVFLQNGLVYFKENIDDTISIKSFGVDTLILDNSMFVKDIKPKNIMICE